MSAPASLSNSGEFAEAIRVLRDSADAGENFEETDVWRSLSSAQQDAARAELASGAAATQATAGPRKRQTATQHVRNVKPRTEEALQPPVQPSAGASSSDALGPPRAQAAGDAVVIGGRSYSKAGLRDIEVVCTASAKQGTPPPGSHFSRVIPSFMYASGDGPEPDPAAAYLIERDALAYAARVLRSLRAVLGSDRTAVRVGDFASVLPCTLKMYLRWKLLKGMAKTEETEAEGQGVADGGAGAAGTDAADAAQPEDEVALQSAGRSGLDVSVTSTDGLSGAEEWGTGSGMAVPKGSATPSTAAVIVEEDEEDRQQLALLQAQAEEALRAGETEGASPATASVAVSSTAPAPTAMPSVDLDLQLDGLEGTDATGPEAEAMRAFKERLSFANTRSSRLSVAGYESFARAREVGFLGGKLMARHFAAALPQPPINRTILEVLAYMAYERVTDIVETANRAVHEGQLTPMDPQRFLAPGAKVDGGKVKGKGKGKAKAELDHIPLPAYLSALSSAPLLPRELQSRVDVLRVIGQSRAVGEGLRQARQAHEARAEAENDEARRKAEAVRQQWAATGGRDLAGEAAFLAAMGTDTGTGGSSSKAPGTAADAGIGAGSPAGVPSGADSAAAGSSSQASAAIGSQSQTSATAPASAGALDRPAVSRLSTGSGRLKSLKS